MSKRGEIEIDRLGNEDALIRETIFLGKLFHHFSKRAIYLANHAIPTRNTRSLYASSQHKANGLIDSRQRQTITAEIFANNKKTKDKKHNDKKSNRFVKLFTHEDPE